MSSLPPTTPPSLLHGDVLVALVTALLVIATLASVVTTWLIGRRQEYLQRALAEETCVRNAQHARLQETLASQQRLFEQRTHLIPLWQYISSLSDINPARPVTPDVVAAVNTLEFIAICCEAQVVDRNVVMRTFREKYMEFYKKIESCGNLAGYTNPTRNGRQLLDENRAAQGLYNDLRAELLQHDRIVPL